MSRKREVSGTVFGYEWTQIQAMQSGSFVRPTVKVSAEGDYGADPVGDGTFRMVPSGDVVSFDEMRSRLAKRGF